MLDLLSFGTGWPRVEPKDAFIEEGLFIVFEWRIIIVEILSAKRLLSLDRFDLPAGFFDFRAGDCHRR